MRKQLQRRVREQSGARWARARRRGLLKPATAIASLIASGALPAGATAAITSSTISGDTLQVTSDGNADEVRLRLKPTDGNLLEVYSGNTLFEIENRSSFTKILVQTGAGNDTIRIDETAGSFTTTESTTVLASVGDDSIVGGSGAETFNGGSENDTIECGFGADGVDAGSGNDTAYGDQGDDTLFGGSGNDTLDGQYGLDSIRGGFGSDILKGGEGGDIVYGEEDADLLDDFFDDGPDTLSGGLGNDTFEGGPGTDLFSESFNTADSFTLKGDSAGADATGGGLGVDTLVAIEGAYLFGSDDADSITASAFGGGPVTVWGSAGNDTVSGTSLADFIAGGTGGDSISGNAGQDSLYGLNGNFDVGIDSNDTLKGGTEDDLISGETGADSLQGEGGNDTLTGGGGDFNDNLLGGSGTNHLVESADSNMTLTGDATNAQLTGMGTDTLSLIADALLTGGVAANALNAGGSSIPVTLDGQAGNDTLTAGTANDSLIGGTNTDLLQATADANLTLASTLLSGIGSDTLSGFEQGRLTGGASPNVLNASTFGRTVTLNGMLGPDTLTGGVAGDSLIGSGGDDSLVPAGGNDSVDGGGDNDTLRLAGDNLQMTAGGATGEGSDSHGEIETALLQGTGAASRLDISTFDGRATLDGLGGNDTLTGGGEDDSLKGGEGDDLLNGGDSDATMDTLSGGNGLDRMLSSCACSVTVEEFGLDSDGGLGGDLFLSGAIEEVELRGIGSGNSIFDAAAFPGPVTLVGAGGNDRITGGALNDSLVGGTGNDTLAQAGDTSFTLTDTTLTGKGADTLSGFEQAELTGGPGPNTIDASAFSGSSALNGESDLSGASDDSLAASAGGSTLVGAGGNDTLRGGPAGDVFYALEGNDLLAAAADAALSFKGGGTKDFGVLTGQGADTVYPGVDAVSLSGGASGNVLDTSESAVPATLDGAGGDDTLTGGPANDSLVGGDGADRLDGRAGADTLSCGAELDTFVADPLDVLAADCEAPPAPPVEQPPSDQPATDQPAIGQPSSDPPMPDPQTMNEERPLNGDRLVPLVLRFVAAPPTFRLAGTNTASSGARRPPKGTTLEYELSEDATAKIVLSRLVPGLRVKSSRARKAKLVCKPATPAVKRRATREVVASVSRTLPAVQRRKRIAALLKARKCTATKPVATLTRKARKGRNKLPFSGRVDRKPLPLGRYEAALTATDAARNVSKPKKARFKIVR